MGVGIEYFKEVVVSADTSTLIQGGSGADPDPEPEGSYGISKFLSEIMARSLVVLPSFLGLPIGILFMVILVPASWPILMVENLFVFPKLHGWRKAVELYGCALLGIALGLALIALVPFTRHIGWLPLAALYVVPAPQLGVLRNKDVTTFGFGTVMGVIWLVLFFSMFR